MNLGWLIPVLVLLPNLLMVRFPPEGKPQSQPVAPTLWVRIFEILERLGQAGAFFIPCLYRITWQGIASAISLGVMAASLALYYGCWARYLLHGRAYTLLFASLWGIPLPMAVAPVVTFSAAALLLRSWPLGIAAMALAIGHIVVSERERRHIIRGRSFHQP